MVNPTWQTPGVSDNIDQAPEVTCSPPSGSAFAIGVLTRVTCTATDSAENTVDCTFNVVIGEYSGRYYFDPRLG